MWKPISEAPLDGTPVFVMALIEIGHEEYMEVPTSAYYNIEDGEWHDLISNRCVEVACFMEIPEDF